MSNFRNKGRVASQQSRSSQIPMPESKGSSWSRQRPQAVIDAANQDLANRNASWRVFNVNNPPRLRRQTVSVAPTKFVQRSNKFRAFRKQKRNARYPKWFQILARQDVPTHVAGQYTGSIAVAINSKAMSVHWKHLSLIDIQNTLSGAVAVNASTLPGSNQVKNYITNVVRRHQWRNSEQNAACHITCYVMYPRRDLPAYASVAAAQALMPSISPGSSNVGTVGGGLVDPAMWQQGFADESKTANLNAKIGFADPATTPYMNNMFTQFFRIRRLKMKFPDGYKAQGILEPGQTLLYVGRRMKPEMVSYNKYGLNGAFAYTIPNTWEVLRTTPLIVLQIKGTASHDTTTKTLVGLGPANLDYVQDFTYDIWAFANATGSIANPITSPATVAQAEQVEVVTASVGIEALA